MEITNAEEVEAALQQMTFEQRDHLRMIIASLIQCYLHKDTPGLVLLGEPTNSVAQVIAVNATDMQAANLLQSVDGYLNFRLLDEAPPKGMMN